MAVPLQENPMSLTLELPKPLESRLRDEAARRGVEVEALALPLIERQLESQSVPSTNSLGQLFAAWEAEDATSDPEEIARRQREWNELKDSLNAHHGSFRDPIR
jgi:hypothetical protein